MYRKMIGLLILVACLAVIFSSIFIYKNTEANYEMYLNEFTFEEHRKIDAYYASRIESIKGIVESHAYWDEALEYLEKEDEQWLAENASTYIVENDIFSIDYILIANEDLSFVQESDERHKNILLNNNLIQETLNDDVDHLFIECIDEIDYLIYSTTFKDNEYENATGIFVSMLELDQEIISEINSVLYKNALSVELLCDSCEEDVLSLDELILFHSIGDTNYDLKIIYDEDYLRHFFISNRSILIITLAVILLLVIAVLSIAMRRIKNHISEMVNAIVNVSRGNYNNKIATDKMIMPELNVLAAAVDTLSTTINEKNKLVEQNYIEMVDLLYKSVSVIDEYTANHGLAVALYSKFICKCINYRDVDNIFLAAKIHDIGKIAIPISILNKPSKITHEEFEIMKKHPEYGYKIISQISYFKYAKYGVKHHHEAWNGTGYPDGLKGNDIPITAQIIALADIYDALTTARVYRKAFSHEEAKKIIIEERNKKLNPILVEVFLENEKEFKNLNERINGSREAIEDIEI